MIQTLVAFMAGTTLAIVYRLLAHGEFLAGEGAWAVLTAAAAAPVPFIVFYPRPPQK